MNPCLIVYGTCENRSFVFLTGDVEIDEAADDLTNWLTEDGYEVENFVCHIVNNNPSNNKYNITLNGEIWKLDFIWTEEPLMLHKNMEIV